MKQKIRLTESQLHNVIRKYVNEAICDSTQKDFETREAWKDFEYQNALPDFGSEKICYNRKPTIKTPNGRTLINAHGVAGDENLNVHDLGGSAAMHAMSDDPNVNRNAKNLRSILSQTGNPIITLPESQLHNVIRKCVNEALNEMWDMDDNGIIDYDENGVTYNRSYSDTNKLPKNLPNDTLNILKHTPHRDIRANKNFVKHHYEPNDFSDDRGRKIRPSDWYVRGSDDYKNDVNSKQQKKNKKIDNIGDTRPLHRKDSLNREL